MSAVAREEAIAWMARLAEAENPAVRTEFEQWKAARPENTAAFEAIARLWSDLGKAEALDASLDRFAEPDPAAAPAREPLVSRLWGRWRATALGAAAAFAAVVAALVLAPGMLRTGPGQPIAYASAGTGITTQTLGDGSIVTLGPQSEIRVAMSDTGRSVELVKGEAFFDVTSDPARPFTVAADRGMVRVVGTEFDVRRGSGALRVDVREGVVEVAWGGAEAETFTAGEGALVVDGRMERRTLDPGEVASWRSGRLVYDDMPLAIIASDLERYWPGGRVEIAPDIRALRLTASFQNDQIEAALEAVALSHGLRLERGEGGDIRLSAPR